MSNGVPAAVLVNVDRRAVSVYRPTGPILVLRGDDAVDLGDILPGLRFTVRELFGALKLR